MGKFTDWYIQELKRVNMQEKAQWLSDFYAQIAQGYEPMFRDNINAPWERAKFGPSLADVIPSLWLAKRKPREFAVFIPEDNAPPWLVRDGFVAPQPGAIIKVQEVIE